MGTCDTSAFMGSGDLLLTSKYAAALVALHRYGLRTYKTPSSDTVLDYNNVPEEVMQLWRELMKGKKGNPSNSPAWEE